LSDGCLLRDDYLGARSKEKVAAGASLLQIYSGFIYRGVELIKESAEAFDS